MTKEQREAILAKCDEHLDFDKFPVGTDLQSYLMGTDYEYNKLIPIIRTLLDVNERLHEACNARLMHDEDCMDSEETFKEFETCECGAKLCEHALAFEAEELRKLGVE